MSLTGDKVERIGFTTRLQWLKEFARQNPLLMLLAVLAAILSVTTPRFLSPINVINVARQTSYLGIAAVGVSLLMIGGELDMSTGSVAVLSATVAAAAVKHFGLPLPVAILLGLLAGVLSGTVLGYSVIRWQIPSFIASLGLMSIDRGAVLVYTNGNPISGFPPGFDLLATGRIVGVPVPFVIFMTAVVVGEFVLRRTKLGRYAYAIGGNVEAARLAGINVNLVKLTSFIICSLLASISGLMLAALLDSAVPVMAQGMELSAIVATVIGGTSLLGGRGTIVGAVIGAFLIAILQNGMNMMQVSIYWQQIAVGFLLLATVLVRRGR